MDGIELDVVFIIGGDGLVLFGFGWMEFYCRWVGWVVGGFVGWMVGLWC